MILSCPVAPVNAARYAGSLAPWKGFRLRNPRVRLALGLILGISLLSWFLWSIHWPELTSALATVDIGTVVLAAAVLFVEFFVRTLRWRVLLRPIAPHVRLSSLFAATVIGAATNTLLPARAGEVARPLALCRREGIPLAPVVATNVVERVFDLVGLLSVFLVMLAVLPATDGPEGELVRNLRRYGFLFGGLGVAGVIFLVALGMRGGPLKDFFKASILRLPGALPARIVSVLDGFMSGLASMRSRRDVAVATLLTLTLWMNGVLAIQVLFTAVDIPLPLGASCFTAVAIALTVVLPQAPGFVGVFHVAMEKTLVLWGQPAAPAQVFAILFWGISYVPVTAVGLIALWREGITPGALTRRPDETPS